MADRRTVEVLTDLADRLRNKATALDALADSAGSEEAATGWDGEATGVRLALSFVEEAIHGL